MTEEATKKYMATATVEYEFEFPADVDIDAVTLTVRNDFVQHIRDFVGEDARLSFELRPLEEEGVMKDKAS